MGMLIIQISEKCLCRERCLTMSCGRGVFNISMNVAQGECYGFLGPNGAGKTTTIRHLMGFSKADSGRSFIKGKDCWKHADKLKRQIGYIPGEIALPEEITGKSFLNMILTMHGYEEKNLCRQLLERFQLREDKKTREMSLGEKRKLAIVAAFMHDPEILILDEPTSGLDPVMQQEFIDLIKEEKSRGKTIFLSSHIFSEVDAVCDRISIIKDGRIVSDFMVDKLKNTQDGIFVIGFENRESYEAFRRKDYMLAASSEERLKVKARVPSHRLNHFIADMSQLQIRTFHQVKFSLEDYFMDFYKTGEEEK